MSCGEWLIEKMFVVSKILFCVAFRPLCFFLPYFYFHFHFIAWKLIIRQLRDQDFLEQGIYNFYSFDSSCFHRANSSPRREKWIVLLHSFIKQPKEKMHEILLISIYMWFFSQFQCFVCMCAWWWTFVDACAYVCTCVKRSEVTLGAIS